MKGVFFKQQSLPLTTRFRNQTCFVIADLKCAKRNRMLRAHILCATGNQYIKSRIHLCVGISLLSDGIQLIPLLHFFNNNEGILYFLIFLEINVTYFFLNNSKIYHLFFTFTLGSVSF